MTDDHKKGKFEDEELDTEEVESPSEEELDDEDDDGGDIFDDEDDAM